MRRRWRTALADAEMTEKAWAESIGVSSQHVSEVLFNGRAGEAVMRRAIAFVQAREQLIAKRVARAAGRPAGVPAA